MISAVTMNQVREALCNQYVLTQLSATQLQHLQKNYVLAKRLRRLYLKREFEVALMIIAKWEANAFRYLKLNSVRTKSRIFR